MKKPVLQRCAAVAAGRVIKAYDVRGLVGEEVDEQFVADVGGAFARLVRADGDSGARQVVVGHDMRSSSPSLAGASPREWWPRASM